MDIDIMDSTPLWSPEDDEQLHIESNQTALAELPFHKDIDAEESQITDISNMAMDLESMDTEITLPTKIEKDSQKQENWDMLVELPYIGEIRSNLSMHIEQQRAENRACRKKERQSLLEEKIRKLEEELCDLRRAYGFSLQPEDGNSMIHDRDSMSSPKVKTLLSDVEPRRDFDSLSTQPRAPPSPFKFSNIAEILPNGHGSTIAKRKRTADELDSDRPSKTVRAEAIRPYNGESLDDYIRFKTEVKSVLSLQPSMTEEERIEHILKCIPSRLQTLWERECDSRPDAQATLDRLLQILLSLIQDPIGKEIQLATSLHNAQQQPCQSVEAFASYLSDLEAQIIPPFPEKHSMMRLLGGLRENIRAAIHQRNYMPENRQGLVDLAKAIENSLP